MNAGTRFPRSMYLIDAHSLIFQVFHAIPEMSSPSGLPTNALYGFTRDVLFLREEKKPDYVLAAFDRSEPTFRDRIYPQYKAKRSPMPEDLRSQIPLIHQMLEAMRIPVLSKEGYEADDVIATVARAAAERGIDVSICTSDKDCRQLIHDRVRLYNLRKKETLDRDGLLRDWAITPEQVVELQALVGDPVDNVPGVPGVGIKTAAKLLQEFGTIDNLLANLDRVAGAKLKENLRSAGEKIQLSKNLVRLACDVPLEIDWEGWRLQAPDVPRCLALFREWGFHRFADDLRALARKTPEQQGELFPSPVRSERTPDNNDAVPRRIRPHWKATYHLVDTPAKFDAFLGELRGQKRIAIDLETTGLGPRESEIVGYALCWRSGEAWYLPVRGPEGSPLLDPADTLARLRPILENSEMEKVNQNVKYDMLVLREHGVRLAGVAGDPMVADYLLHAGERSHSMDDLANRYLDHEVIPITDLIGKKGKNQLQMDQVATERVAEYAGEDSDVAWRLSSLLHPKLQEEGLSGLYQDLEVPLIEVLAELEFNGVRLDLPLLGRLGQEMAGQLADIEAQIHRLAGRSFNIASPKQLREVLFDELKLPRQRLTGITGEASTNQETLERLAALGHEIPRKIVEYRQVAKLKGTYVDALPDLVNPATGRVHASFNQTVAATGRLSSSDPNLQNIPVRSEQGRQIRQAFVAEPGWLLLTADYSQIELRLLAHLSQDPALQQAFAEDRDIHAIVATQIFGVPESEVTSEMRRVAKTVNFGVLYGMSAPGLATRLGISREDATRFIESYFARYPKVAEYQTSVLRKCDRDRFVSTFLGRKREVSGIKSDSTYLRRNQPEREAINMEIQGSAADLIKVAMLNIYRRLRAEHRRARMILQIHDELVLEVPADELAAVAELVAREMTTALTLDVPLKVDLAAGPNWLEVSDLELLAA
jgi:DNA polymerase-1